MLGPSFRTLNFILAHPLGRRHRWAAIGRWLRWQIASKILPYPIAVPFVGTTHLVQERGTVGSTGNFYVGLHEFSDMALVLHFLRPEDYFFDIGANVGSFSLLAGGVAGARCFSFEPVPTTFSRLERNVRFNRLENNVQCRCVALGAGEGSIRFTADRDAMNQVVNGDYAGKTINVPVICLDSLKDELASPFQAMVWKVDVEGYEQQVLAGAESLLQDPRLKIILLEADDDAINATMTNSGFCRAEYDPFQRRLEETTEFRQGRSNQFWVRDLAFIRNRLESAAAFRVLEETI